MFADHFDDGSIDYLESKMGGRRKLRGGKVMPRIAGVMTFWLTW
jgi:hypothetical protein